MQPQNSSWQPPRPIVEPTPDSPILRVGQIVGAALFLLVAPVVGYLVIADYLEGRASSAWPTTVALVTEAHVEELRKGTKVHLRYQFDLEGKRYYGTRARVSDGKIQVRGAQEVLGNLQVGQQVPVHYDPADPNRCVLEPGPDTILTGLLLVPVGMLLLGSFMLWRGVSRAPLES